MLADTTAHAGIVPLHRGKGVGVDQGQIGAGGAQRQQLALEPAPVHLRLGQAAGAPGARERHDRRGRRLRALPHRRHAAA